LRLIAGLLAPTSGQIHFNDRDVTALPTQHRNAVMCFQNYALWPHLTVRQNVRFGLDVRHLGRSERDRRVAEALEMVQLGQLAERRPAQLSGGQQQRVALARALAVKPACLLLDEPLSNLDAQLRIEMRSEIRRICKSAGCTTLYVTHDQKEALSVADRLAVLKDGRLIQYGTPAELYHRPRTSFAAAFLGQTNLIRGQVIAREGQFIRAQTALGPICAQAGAVESAQSVIVSIRPEQIRVGTPEGGRAEKVNRLTGKLTQTTFLGESTECVIEIAGQSLRFTTTRPPASAGGDLTVEFAAEDALALVE
jgi:iron(III) transport system ATP-binding protein